MITTLPALVYAASNLLDILSVRGELLTGLECCQAPKLAFGLRGDHVPGYCEMGDAATGIGRGNRLVNDTGCLLR